jgi:hypothetical protein
VVAEWWQATSDEKLAMVELIEVVKRRLDVEYGPDGYNVGFNSGSAAGQTVDHLHVHVIPRYRGDVDDPRGGIRHVIPGRGNYLAGGSHTGPRQPLLVTPAEGRLKLELLRCLIRPDLDRIDLLVSFVLRSGIDLIARHLDDALARGARVRLLTTDYLEVTDSGRLSRSGHHGDRVEPRDPPRRGAGHRARVALGRRPGRPAGHGHGIGHDVVGGVRFDPTGVALRRAEIGVTCPEHDGSLYVRSIRPS